VSEAEAKKKPGPVSIKSPELMEEICTRIAEGRSVKNICNDEDMPSFGFVWRWISEDAVFEHRYARAIQQRAMNHADQIIELEQQVMRGEIPSDVARVVLDARKWTASRLLPKVYGDKQIVEANVTHTHQLHLDALRALSARRSGNDLGYIEGQAIDITNDPTFSGERQDQDRSHVNSPHVNNLAQIGSPDASLGLDPPGGGIVPGGGLAPPTATRTRKKRSDPPPPGTPKRRPAKKQKSEK
jgi:hypothetical protein